MWAAWIVSSTKTHTTSSLFMLYFSSSFHLECYVWCSLIPVCPVFKWTLLLVLFSMLEIYAGLNLLYEWIQIIQNTITFLSTTDLPRHMEI